MKVGIYDPYLDTLGGGERYMLTAAACLSHSHTVTVFWDEKTILAKAADKFSLDLSRVSLMPNIFSPAFSPIRKLRFTQKYDCLFILSDGSIPVTLARKTFLHFQFPVEWVRGNSLTTQLKMKHISQIICNSEYTKSFIDKKFDVRSVVLYPPVQLEKFPGKKKNIILTVGRFNKLSEGGSFKKHEVMIKAFKKLAEKKMKNWKLVLVISHTPQDEEEITKLKALTQDFPIDILSAVSHERLHSLYQESKIYWHAAGYGEDLRHHPERAEHFGISTVEAMAAGAVPVVINAGGQKEIVHSGENGFLWNTTDELLDYTYHLASDQPLWEKISKAAENEATKFDQNHFCARLQHLLTS